VSILQFIITALITGFGAGLLIGLKCLASDHKRHRKTKILEVKDGIKLEYDYSDPGIYDTLKEMIAGK
jgi:hypothetical protein